LREHRATYDTLSRDHDATHCVFLAT